MPFRFRLQKVLDYREQLEEEAKVRLARAERDLRAGMEKLEAINAEIQRAEEKCAGKLMNSGDRWLHDQYLMGLNSDQHEASMQVRIMEQTVATARKYLAERAIERKSLDKLKERQKHQYIRSEQKQEQIFNDEISTIRYKASPV